MKLKELHTQIALGEDSSRQFKSDVRNAESLASEMAALANSEGGMIYLGVADDGIAPGLDKADVARLNQLISNAASQLVKSPLTVRTENVALRNNRLVIVLTVPKGLDKPYFDKNGVIWLKTGSDKRRVNSKEELRRLFQMTDQFHADELPTKAGIDKLDKLRFRDFLRDVYKQDYPDDPEELTRLLQNMNLATDDGKLNLARLRTGNSNIRNPILVSYVAKGLLPYHGLGSGIKRALAEWPRIDFADNRDGCLFTATVHRNAMDALELVNISPKSSLKTDTVSGKRRESVGKASGKILNACREKPAIPALILSL